MRVRGCGLIIPEKPVSQPPPPLRVVPALGVTQILAWGSSFYLPAVLAKPIAEDTGWPLTWVIAGLSLGLLIAGLISPLVGRRIRDLGGRPVLIASALLLAAGFTVLAVAPTLPIFIAGWAVMGLGMGAGLYDAAFSTLGRLYGLAARKHITTLTLFGGLASTTCWPLSAFFLSTLGWRSTCGAYAAIQILIAVPIYLFALKGRVPPLASVPSAPHLPPRDGIASHRALFLLLAVCITIASMLSTVISVHLLTLLEARGLTLATAVALGALVGPSQVGARFIEMLISRYHHPIWTKIAAVSLVASGLLLLWIGLPLIPLCLICYGAGIGLESIARATLPLALFGPADYAPIMGRLARPSLIAQAATPSIGALLIEHLGTEGMLGSVTVLALLNVGLVGALVLRVAAARRHAVGLRLV
jgi:predicted MFS family arabinose efflux permease